MTEIVSSVSELKELDTEIKNINTKLSKLRKRKKELEKQIVDFLDKKEQSGLKYRDVTIVAEKKDKRNRLKKNDKIDKATNILKKYGIHNIEMTKDLINNLKGSPTTVKSIKIKKNM